MEFFGYSSEQTLQELLVLVLEKLIPIDTIESKSTLL
jgi:hypothetical protein